MQSSFLTEALWNCTFYFGKHGFSCAFSPLVHTFRLLKNLISECASSYLQAMLLIGQHLEIFEVRVLFPLTALTWHFIAMDI